jgi:small subunit ribosomal protein S1
MSNEEKNVNQTEEAVTHETAEQQEASHNTLQENPAAEAKTHIPENIQPDGDFNWDKFESGESEYSDQEKQHLESLYTQNLSVVGERQLITGKVVNITDRDVVLNIGFKSDGLVPLSEFKDRESINIGDEVEVLVEELEDENGQLVLSYKKGQAERAWETIVDAYENDKILNGYVRGRTKGGMIVDLLGLDSFMPGSQIDIKPIRDYDAFVGQHMDVKVVKLNYAFRNIVVSHKAIIESDLEQQKADILSKLEKGQVLEGTVKNLTSFGVFVDLGGVDGLIHITDVSWGRINHPEEVLELGQKVNTVVLDFDQDKKRISLGLKQLTSHPWETLPDDIQEGTQVKGKVVNIEDYGAFIEIHPGVEGLVHVSEMSWSQHLKSPEEYVSLGDEVDAVVLSIDREERKLSLGMKQLTTDPWDGIEQKYPVNSTHTATVRSITNFGLFMELEEGVDGLVHISDLSWTKKFNHPNEYTKLGESLDVKVLDIDKENRRLSLGIKQLEDDPWDNFESIFYVDSVHEGTINRIEDKGAIVEMPYGLEAFAPNKHLHKEDKTKPEAEETLEFKVIEFDKNNRKIIVSHTDVWKERERAKKQAEKAQQQQEEAETRQNVEKVKSKVETPRLGEENEKLSSLRDKMEEEEKEKQKEAMERMEKQEDESEDSGDQDQTSTAQTEDSSKEESQADSGSSQSESEAEKSVGTEGSGEADQSEAASSESDEDSASSDESDQSSSKNDDASSSDQEDQKNQ